MINDDKRDCSGFAIQVDFEQPNPAGFYLLVESQQWKFQICEIYSKLTIKDITKTSSYLQMFYQISVSKNLCKIYRKTPVSESLNRFHILLWCFWSNWVLRVRYNFWYSTLGRSCGKICIVRLCYECIRQQSSYFSFVLTWMREIYFLSTKWYRVWKQ